MEDLEEAVINPLLCAQFDELSISLCSLRKAVISNQRDEVAIKGYLS